MKKYSIVSSFESLPIEIFWYPSVKTKHTIIILKGIYRLHDPKSKKSWEIELIKELNPLYNILCINTARKQKKSRNLIKNYLSIKHLNRNVMMCGKSMIIL